MDARCSVIARRAAAARARPLTMQNLAHLDSEGVGPPRLRASGHGRRRDWNSNRPDDTRTGSANGLNGMTHVTPRRRSTYRSSSSPASSDKVNSEALSDSAWRVHVFAAHSLNHATEAEAMVRTSTVEKKKLKSTRGGNTPTHRRP